jgi:hypothetical protein
MQGKIIGVGFQKTGTSTLREALKILGYTVKDTSSRPIIPIFRGNYGKVLRMIRNYDAIEDTPWYMIYRELDEMIPGSKFILTIRDEESWYRSVSRHIGDLRSPQHEWIYGRGKGLPKDDRENTIKVYRRHNAGVLEYFKDRPDDLLVLDFTKGDKWEKMCAFLDREIPQLPFPHANKTRDNRSEMQNTRNKIRFFRKQIRNNIKLKYIDIMGYWPEKK